MRTLRLLTGTALCLGAMTIASAQHEARKIDVAQPSRSGLAMFAGTPPTPAVLDGIAYFTMYDTESGLELWRTDATPAGTYRVTDAERGATSSTILLSTGGFRIPSTPVAAGGVIWLGLKSGLARYDPIKNDLSTIDAVFSTATLLPGYATDQSGTTVYFYADDAGSSGKEGLWRTHPNSEESTQLLPEVPRPDLLDRIIGDPSPLTAVGPHRMLFSDSFTIWATDGTTHGSLPLIGIPFGDKQRTLQSPSEVISVGDWAYFAASRWDTGKELFRTDGTLEGTQLLGDLTPGPDGSTITPIGAVGSRLYFLLKAGGQPMPPALWKSDGEAASTAIVAELPTLSGTEARLIGSINGRIIWMATATNGNPVLCASDGTASGTAPISYEIDSTRSADVRLITRSDHFLLISVYTQQHGQEPWITDGTAEGTHLLKDLEPGNASGLWYTRGLTLPDGTVLLAGRELWRTDGSEAGTRIACDVSGSARASNPIPMFNHNGFSLFRAYGEDGKLAIWRTRGTPASTSLLTRLYPVTDAPHISMLANTTGKAIYSLQGEMPQYDESRISNGTATGTNALNLSDWVRSQMKRAVRLGADLYFTGGTDGPPGLYRFADREGSYERLELPVASVDRYAIGLASSGDRIYFSGLDDDGARNLWSTDGTAVGTAKLGAVPCYPDLRLLEFGSQLIFGGYQGNPGFGLWSFSLIDGSAHCLHADLVEYSQLTQYAKGVLFIAGNDAHGHDLWTTDGTGEGTVLLEDIHSGLDSQTVRILTPAGDLCFFIAAVDHHGRELWVTDGTSRGTRMVRDILPGTADSNLSDLVEFHDKLYFSADDGIHGRELWCSDGTEEGTHMVKDVYPGPESGGVSGLAVVHGSLYFAGYDHQHGLEVWRSDGTADGTAFFSDVYPGPSSSSPSEFGAAGKFLVFEALSHDGSGFGVWSISLGPAPAPAPATSWLLN